ncbi:MAG: amino acid ABC transporter permease [Candidatus Tectomicrobia bacterium]|uniref:Amino acid ABC transporter permease n=1 Tax=Tectimicrobiota bacterium TaxID=2528274 RepID=A0A932GMZ2_UNCTE|nr:amino acid ABC transporter permease [Candidatus Tectomicrobia bacterium]
MVQGVAATLKLSGLAWLQALVIGLLVGALRTLPWRFLRAIGTVYVEFFRNIPLLVHLFFWYFAAPEVLPQAFREWLVEHGVEFWSAVLGLGVYSGARFGEVFRAGIQAVPRALLEASASTGLSTAQDLLKNSSLALTIGVAELTFMTRQVESYTARGLEAVAAGTLIYLVLCLVVAALMGRVERRLAIPGLIARGLSPEG